jgi:2-succinyl-5-enolpyruvyl-6-hydroxy-3-cyclohexene-1-carboxylate synthase
MTSSQRPPNRNYLWAGIVVDELHRSGLRAVCIAPGSRSTPLAIAFAEHGGVRVYSHIDERSASFFALGLAKATHRPVALVCSSGTAGANFFPAIIEAGYGGVPLLVLTADRPPELRESGANQTIDQVKMFGDHVLWSVDMPLPEQHPPALGIRALRATVCRAYAIANGLDGVHEHGAVHLNFPFRKPLEPVEVASDITDDPAYAPRPDGEPYTRFDSGRLVVREDEVTRAREWMSRSKRPLITIGPDVREQFRTVHPVLLGRVPIMADVLSGARFSPSNADEDGHSILGGYDTFLRAPALLDRPDAYPDLIIRLGAVNTSQPLNDYLNDAPGAYTLLIGENGTYRDANHQTNTMLYIHPDRLAYIFGFDTYRGRDREQAEAEQAALNQWNSRLHRLEAETWKALERGLGERWFDGAVVADVFAHMPDRSAVFLGNSLPVRHADQFARPNTRDIRMYGNRGTSGIDGNISTALGAAAGDDRPLVAIVGDLTFYHDMNGLLATRRAGAQAVFVVINNDGGGIFERLPIARYEPPYTDLFRTPHGLRFAHTAALYGLEYAQPADRAGFGEALTAALARLPQRSSIIEVTTDAADDLAHRNALMSAAHKAAARVLKA